MSDLVTTTARRTPTNSRPQADAKAWLTPDGDDGEWQAEEARKKEKAPKMLCYAREEWMVNRSASQKSDIRYGRPTGSRLDRHSNMPLEGIAGIGERGYLFYGQPSA